MGFPRNNGNGNKKVGSNHGDPTHGGGNGRGHGHGHGQGQSHGGRQGQSRPQQSAPNGANGFMLKLETVQLDDHPSPVVRAAKRKAESAQEKLDKIGGGITGKIKRRLGRGASKKPLPMDEKRSNVPKPPMFSAWVTWCVVGYSVSEISNGWSARAKSPFFKAHCVATVLGAIALFCLQRAKDGRLKHWETFWKYTKGWIHPGMPTFLVVFGTAVMVGLHAIDNWKMKMSLTQRALPILLALACVIAGVELWGYIVRTTRRRKTSIIDKMKKAKIVNLKDSDAA